MAKEANVYGKRGLRIRQKRNHTKFLRLNRTANWLLHGYEKKNCYEKKMEFLRLNRTANWLLHKSLRLKRTVFKTEENSL